MLALVAAACAPRADIPVLVAPAPTLAPPIEPLAPPTRAPATPSAASAPPDEAPFRAPLLGQTAPALRVSSLNGRGPISLEGWAGKVVLVTFWATWCEPCKRSLPQFQRLSRTLQGELEIVGLSEDDELTGLKAYGVQYGLGFALAWGQRKELASRWQVNTMPMTYVLDRKGVVRFVHSGFQPGDEVDLEREIRSLL